MVIMVTLIGSNPIPLAIPWTERSVPVRAWPAVQNFIEFFMTDNGIRKWLIRHNILDEVKTILKHK